MHRITNSCFGSADSAHVTHSATLTHETPYEAIFDPFFWSTVAKKIRIGDKIEIFAEDGTYYAEVIVVSCTAQWVKIKTIIEKVNLVDNSEEPKEESGFEIKWRGPHKKFSVMKDKVVLQDGIDDKDTAISWLAEHKKIMGK